MLTNGKKIWGIWNGGNFICDPTTLHIEVYDDLEVAKQQIESIYNRDPNEEQVFEPRVITEGHPGGGQVAIETKAA